MQNTVADFDPQQVVDTVQSKIAPEDWLVVTARRGPLFTQALKNGLYAIGSGIASLFCFYLWLAVIFHLIEEPSIIIGMTLLFVGAIWGALGFWGFARQAWMTIRLLMAVQELWIAVTPNGIVEYRGAKMGIGFTCAFANVISIERTIKQPSRFNHQVALTFRLHHPSIPKRRLILQRQILIRRAECGESAPRDPRVSSVESDTSWSATDRKEAVTDARTFLLS